MKAKDITLEKLREWHEKAAQLVLADSVYAPIFERLDRELSNAEARAADDPVAKARAVLARRNPVGA